MRNNIHSMKALLGEIIGQETETKKATLRWLS